MTLQFPHDEGPVVRHTEDLIGPRGRDASVDLHSHI